VPNIVITILAVGFVLGVMVLVHEWGHFVVAKLFGVRVEIFSIGFGPRLWGYKKGDTDYRISGLPLGGYVKMAGDNPLEDRKGDPDEFLSKPRWQRVLIALAGPAMNIILSILIVTGIYLHGSKQPAWLDRPMVLAGVLPGSTAEKVGLAPGDRVVKINGVSNPTWDDADWEWKVSMVRRRSVSLAVDRNGQELSFFMPTSQELDGLDLFGYPQDRLVISSVSAGMPAERSGLKQGDEVLQVDGKPLGSSIEFPPLVEKSRGRPMDLEIRRNGQIIHAEVRAQQVGMKNGLPHWQIGVGIQSGDLVMRRLSLGRAVAESVAENTRMTRLVAQVVVELLRGNMSLSQLQGPLGIAQASGQAARQGIGDLLGLMATVGVNLAVLNLLPIPPLDGGHILMLFIEGTIRRDLSVRVKERFVTVSMVFLLLVFAIVMYNDVLRLIPHH
jgi:regulator of sigma E protease